ncbi:hypothetical protein [Poriferisphaera sp. WC338]|uniref:hypothetical protein n=1 Tax=Poriferisphaera sp. WC338 TaxID=3425129 RepID=UPI003D8153B1
MAETRQNLNIELAHGSKEKLEKLRDWNGMTQKELVSRIMGWFCMQDRVVQQIILGQIPSEIAPDVAQLLLRKLADRNTPSQANTPTDHAAPALIVEIPPDPATA